MRQLLIERKQGLPWRSRSTIATEHAPQSPSAQPSFEPVNPCARSQSSKVVFGETESRRTSRPLRRKAIVLFIRLSHHRSENLRVDARRTGVPPVRQTGLWPVEQPGTAVCPDRRDACLPYSASRDPRALSEYWRECFVQHHHCVRRFSRIQKKERERNFSRVKPEARAFVRLAQLGNDADDFVRFEASARRQSGGVVNILIIDVAGGVSPTASNH